MARIVSLIASATEIISALGFEDQLVGRSHECDFPESVRRLPVCTEPKFNVSGTSGEIDRRVKETLQESLSVYRVDEAKLKELRPDVIVTQSHCEVCAVSLRDVRDAVGQWLGTVPAVISLSPNRLEDVWKNIHQVAEVLDVPERGIKLVGQLRQRMAATAQKAAAISRGAGCQPAFDSAWAGWQPAPRVACLEWIEPLMAAGNWMPELVAMAGGLNLFGEAGTHSTPMSWEDLRNKDPNIIMVLPCGFDIARSRQDMPLLTAKPGWSELKAVKHRKVFLADGNQYFNRPGPRLVESLEILAELCHPDVFHFGHEGYGWQRF